MENTVIWFLV